MVNMADYLRQLEAYEDLEGKIIRETKVYKVLKAIIKLDNIPQEELHNFKQRSSALLNKWNLALAAADSESADKTTPAATNGVKADDEKSQSAKADTPVVEKKEDETKDEPKESVEEPAKAEPTEEKEAPMVDAPAEPAAEGPADKDGDVSMADVEATKEAPAIIDAPNPEGVNAATTESKSETAAATTS
jgi:hypothetical protein